MDIKCCTDEELLERLLPETKQEKWEHNVAWVEFTKRFGNLLLRAISATYRRCAPQSQVKQEDLDDLFQHIMMKLFKNNYHALREFRYEHKHSMRLFLYTVAINTTFNHIRANRVARRPQISNSLSEPAFIGEKIISYGEKLKSSGPNPEEEYQKKEMLEQAIALIESECKEQNRERDRRIFLMAHQEGLTSNEIAEHRELGLTTPGINSVLRRIKKRLEEFWYDKQ